MEKIAYFFIDDVIWVFRDIARKRPNSIFDNSFMKMLKSAHDDFGTTVQLNLFYRTDFFYGTDEFTLSEMPDCYKGEFEANADWLRLAFHAKQEFPDYPYVNASYDDVKHDYDLIVGEIKRFAGEKVVADTICPHWLPISKPGCHALADCGVRLVTPTYGDRKHFDGDHNSLPYGHSFRLLQNRKPETMIFDRGGENAALSRSICAYNHIEQADVDRMRGKNISLKDSETGLGFRSMSGGPCLNLHDVDGVREGIEAILDREFIGVATHEQYYYDDYYMYQPDYEEKIRVFSKILRDNGYRFVTGDELK